MFQRLKFPIKNIDFTHEVGKEETPEKFFSEPETIKYPANYPGITPDN